MSAPVVQSLFSSIQPAAPDAILGLSEAFCGDTNPNKINLSVGIYQDESGATPVLKSVQEAGRRVLAGQTSKSYLPIDGAPAYAAAVQKLMLGEGHDAIASGRATTSHTPGGTGALRVAADFVHQNFPQATIWLTDPTWPNHPSIFAAAGVPTKTFPYFDKATNGLAFEQALAAIEKIPAGDVVLLHGCCHNPTGIDPSPEQWQQLAQAVYEGGRLPLLDFAYQGFAEGIEEDATGLRAFAQEDGDMMVCSSFSKNFGLYRERVGALTMISSSRISGSADGASETAKAVQSQVKRAIRANYSNPPAHGAELVTTILGDAELTQLWQSEVADMRSRINSTRQTLVETLAEKGVPGDFSFISQQRGMFSFSGLTKDQVEKLRADHSIYIVGSGRINVAGITPSNVERLCEAIASVTV